MSENWPKQGEWRTAREFRTAKREGARDLKLALNELRLGCAYTPAYQEIGEVGELVDRIIEKLSIARWRR